MQIFLLLSLFQLLLPDSSACSVFCLFSCVHDIFLTYPYYNRCKLDELVKSHILSFRGAKRREIFNYFKISPFGRNDIMCIFRLFTRSSLLYVKKILPQNVVLGTADRAGGT